MGRNEESTAEVCVGKSTALSAGAVALADSLSEDGRLEISNNRAERSIKPFVMDRKNFLFANTPNGAQGSAIIFSMIETAKENGLDPFHYLVWVLQSTPGMNKTAPDWAAALMPENAPKICFAGNRD